MGSKNTNNMLAFLVFVSSSISAFSLGALAYTFVTGDLPFGIQSLIMEKKAHDDKILSPKKEEKAVSPNDTSDILRINEECLSSFAADLKREKEKIAAERVAIDEQRKNTELIMKQAADMQAKVEAKEQEVNDLLKKADQKERANVAEMQKMISGMDPATALTILGSLDETLAARILFSMNKKISNKLIQEGLRSKASAERIKAIMAKMQSLSDELKGSNQK